MRKSFILVSIILLASIVVVSGCIGQSQSNNNTNNQTGIKDNTSNTAPQPECHNYFWYDDNNKDCSQKEFCGAFMYQGLHTFDIKEECTNAVQDNSKICLQVITPAVDAQGNCKEFSNSCIPDGWTRVDKCPVTGPPAPPQEPTAPSTVNVDIQNFAFATSVISIKRGDTVVWTNRDTAPHTVTSDSGSELSSLTLNNGETYTHIFNETGNFDYHCAFHSGMKGTVIVE